MPFEIVRNDITNMCVDAIVNSANPRPVVGLGTDSSIHEKAGPELLEERRKIGPIGVGEAAITPAFRLSAKFVIHTVGPIVGMEVTEKQKEELKSCYLSCLKLAEKSGLKSIAFCCISTGEFHFPNKLAAQIAVETVDRYLSGSKLERVVFNVFKDEDLNVYRKIFR